MQSGHRPLPNRRREAPASRAGRSRRRTTRSLRPGLATSIAALSTALLAALLAGCAGGLDAFGRRDAAARGTIALPLPDDTAPAIRAQDLAAHVAALTDPATEGRRAGSAGERVAADYLARAFARAGLEPAGDDGGWLHRFSFTAGVSLGADNALRVTTQTGDSFAPPIDDDWRPLAFSQSGDVPESPVVFAGYGLVAPARDGRSAIDEYGDLDVEDRWVMVFRDLPATLDDDARRELRRHAGLRFKAMIARDRGARGILFVSGPRGRFRDELAPLRFDAALAGTSIVALSIRDELARRLVAGVVEPGGETADPLADLQDAVDARFAAGAAPHAEGAPGPAPRVLPGARVAARVSLRTERAEGVNVLGRLPVDDAPTSQQIVIGAHYDALGRGEGSSSLAGADEQGAIHPGADDNASGTALLLELAEALADRVATARARGETPGVRDVVFAAWSGEELGLLGSDAWVDEHVNPHSDADGPVAYLNFDMVGRLRDALVLQGLGSSEAWAALVEAASADLDLVVETQEDSYVPTDATSFYTSGVPVLSGFTGAHAEYHTPRDVAALLELEGTARIGALFLDVAEALVAAPEPPAYRAQTAPAGGVTRGGFRVFLGTIPDYAQTDVRGVRLSGVAPGGPAEQAGLQRGDVIVEVAGRAIENLYDYTFALEAMRVGEPVVIVVERDDARIEREIVPGSRD